MEGKKNATWDGPADDVVVQEWDRRYYNGMYNAVLQCRANAIPEAAGRDSVAYLSGSEIGGLLADLAERAYVHEDGHVSVVTTRRHAGWLDRLAGYTANQGIPSAEWTEQAMESDVGYDQARKSSEGYGDEGYAGFLEAAYAWFRDAGLAVPAGEPMRYVASHREAAMIRMRIPRRADGGKEPWEADAATAEYMFGLYLAEAEAADAFVASMKRPSVAAEYVRKGLPEDSRVLPIADSDFEGNPFERWALPNGRTLFVVDAGGVLMADVYADDSFTRIERTYRDAEGCESLEDLRRRVLADYVDPATGRGS